ncbi:MAG: PP2C family protein-serine/threonine phosphatase [Candidatus Zhuqueibacterota bacterium]
MNRVKITQSDYVLFLVAILLLIVYLVFYAEIFPDASLRFTYDESQIVKKAYEILQNLDFDISKVKHRSRVSTNEEQLRYFQKTFGLKRSNEMILENEIPIYFWRLSLREGKQKDDFISVSYKEQEEAKEEIGKSVSDTITIELSTSGELIGLNVRLGKKSEIDSLTLDEALAMATKFLQTYRPDHYSRYSLLTKDEDKTGTRLDYHFTWESGELIYGEKETVSVSVLGSRIGKFNVKYTSKEIIKDIGYRIELEIIPQIISFIGVIILALIVLIKKLRRDEIDLKSNLFLSIFVMLMWLMMLAMNISTEDERWILAMLIPMLITSPFIFIGFFSVSAIAESEAREVWHEKIFTFDALKNRIILFPQFALSILRGLSMAFIAVGLLAILVKAANSQFSFFLNYDDDRLNNLIALLPALSIIGMAILTSSFGEMVFRLYVITALRKKIGNMVVLAAISGLFWVLAFNGYFNLKLSSYFVNFGINFIIGLVFVIFFLKTDFMTVWWGAFVYIMLRALYPFTFMDDGFLAWNGYAMWVIIGCSIIVALIGLSRRGDLVKIEKYVPDYVQRQAERQRVQRELEIARRVQLSFLPRSKPKIQGIDIASMCIPATEVGGDYFDFIEIDDHHLGVVIGDVSGKGISAAFHMTLTKGFLKSQAKSGLSPREIMINMNELFYENVERGTFISMIYGIFDLRQRNFAFSRAGHNPLLIQKHNAEQVEMLSPRGLALGLENGEIFDRVIEEYKIGIQTNDLFLFYTDGFSEAMNADKEEFGEDRLQVVLESNPDHSAEQVIEAFKKEIFKFVGEAPQHDDMTMLVVKIL